MVMVEHGVRRVGRKGRLYTGKGKLYTKIFFAFLVLSFFGCKKPKRVGEIVPLDGERRISVIKEPKYKNIIPDYQKPATKGDIVKVKLGRVEGKAVKNQLLISLNPETTERKAKKIIEKLGGKIVGGIPSLGIIQVEFEEGKDIKKLIFENEIEEIEVITPNFILSPEVTPNDPEFRRQKWAHIIGLPSAWDISRGGEGLTIAVIDFGFDLEDEDFKNVYLVSSTGDEISREHGTQVLGVIGAIGNNLKGMAGIIWDGKILAFRIDGSIISLIKFILDAADMGAKVINFSGGLKWDHTPSIHYPEDAMILDEQRKLFEPVMRYLYFKDVVFVQAAGNYAWDAVWAGVGAPLADAFPNILIVGSSDESKISYFSSRGYAVKIFAPGEGVLTKCLQDYCLASGTSLSAAQVAGVAGLIRAVKPELSASDVVKAILEGARKVGDIKILSASGALNYASALQPTPKPQETERPTIPSEGVKGELTPYAINLNWQYNPGAGQQSRSSPAITLEGTNWMIYYVTSNNTSPYSALLRKIRDNGAGATLLWTFSLGTGLNQPSYSSPLVGDDGVIYVASSAGVFAVYPSGTSKWWAPLDAGDTILYNSPSLSYEGYLYISSYGQAKLYSFIASSGALRWVKDFRVGGAGNIWGSPAVAPDGTVYVAVDYSTSSTGALYAVSPDGSVKWATQTGRLLSTPSLDCDGTIWICSRDTYCRKFSPTNGSVLVSFQIIGSDTVELSSPAIVEDSEGNKLFFGSVLNNRIHSYFANGTRRWYLSGTGDFQGTPAVSRNLSVWCGSLNNNMYVVYDPTRTAEASNFGAQIWSSPALNTSGRLYVSIQNGRLRAFSSSVDPSSPLPDAAWPKFKHDNQNTGRLHLCTPQGITGTPLSDSQIQLSWVDKTLYEDGYKIERCQGSGCSSFSEVGSITTSPGYGGSVTFTDTLLSEYTWYCYRVRGYKVVGGVTIYSNYSGSVCIRTLLKSPSSLISSAISDSTINLSWTDNSSYESSYHVERSVAGSGYSEIAVLPSNSVSYSDTGLSEGTSYCYRVRACDAGSCSLYSNESCDTTFPKAPTGPTATADSHTQITFSFYDNSSVEEGFSVERRTDLGSWQVIATLGQSPGSGAKVSFVDTNLSPSTTYWYRARSFKGTVYSTYTSEVSATTNPPPSTPPSQPTNAQIVETTGTYVKLSWQDNSSDEEGFVVERCQGSGCDFSVKVTFQISAANVTQYTDSLVQELTLYRYRVYAYNSNGNSSYSNVTETTTKIAEPTNLQGYATGSTKAYLWWQENSSVESNIVVERCTGATCDFSVKVTQVLPANSTNYTWQGMASETTYKFRVYAYSGGNISQYSNSITLTLLYPPTNLFVNPVLPSQIDLSWTDNSAFEQNYRVERCQGAGCTSFSEVAVLSANTTAYSDTGLQANTTYCYRVRATRVDGTSDYTPSSCATTPNAGVAWTFAVAGANSAYSSPSTGADGRIFATGYGTVNARRGIRAINRAGTSIWQVLNTISFFSSPAFDGANVVAGGESSILYKYTSAGALVCSYNRGGAIRSSPSIFSSGRIIFGSQNRYITVVNASCALVGQYLTGGVVMSSPSIDLNDIAFVGSDDGKIYAMNMTGNPLWSYTAGGVVRSSPALGCDGSIYFTAQSGNNITLYALSNSGVLKWQRVLSTSAPIVSATDLLPSPVIGEDGTIYVSASSSQALLYGISDLGSSSSVNMVLSVTGPAIGSPAVDRNGNVWFTAQNRIYKVSGGNIVWFYSMGTQTARSSPLISGDAGRIYVLGGDGLLYAFNTDAYPPLEPVWHQFKGNPQRDGRMKGLCRPRGLTLEIVSHSTAKLTWIRNTIYEDSFYVERSTSDMVFSQIASLPAGITQYTDSNLSENTYYCWRVRSGRGTMRSNYSLTVCGTTKLATPSSLNASPQSSTQISLNWTDNSNYEDSYYVERCLGSSCSGFSTVATLPANSASYNDEGLPEATTYTYRVRAFSSINDSAYSNTATATTYLMRPTGEVAQAVNCQKIEVSWYDNSAKEDGYFVERCQGSGCTSFQVIATLPAGATSYADEPLPEQTLFRYRIRAFNNANIYSLYSSVVEAQTPQCPPQPPFAPSNLTSVAVLSTKIDITWKDNSNNEDGFQIERMPEGSTFSLIATQPTNITYYEDTTATCDIGYTYSVRAYNGIGYSVYSNTSTAVPMCSPSSLSLTPISTSQIDLSWVDNSTREANFEVFRSIDGVSFSAVATLGANTTFWSSTGLQEATIYWFRVRAKNSTGVSSFSNTLSASTKPQAPTSLVAQAQSASSINLTWQDNSAGESGYKVERCQGSGCSSFVEIASLPPNTTSYTDTGLSSTTTYQYRVRAYKSGSDVGVVYSDYSNVSSATTYGAGSAVFGFSVPSGVTTTPALDVDGTIIFGGANGVLYALSPSGSQKWSLNIGSPILSSPALTCDRKVFFGALNGRIYSVNATDGAQNWSVLLGGEVRASPTVSIDGEVYVGTTAGVFYAISSTDGTILRRYPSTGNIGAIYTSAVQDGDLVIFGADDQRIYILDRKTFALVCSTATLGASIRSSPAVDSTGIYVGLQNGVVRKISKSCSVLATSPTLGTQITSSPAISDYVYVGVVSASGAIVALQKTDLSVVSSRLLSGASYSSPAIANDGTIYIASDGGTSGYLWALTPSGSSFQVSFQFALTGQPSLASPSIADSGNIYIGSSWGLYAVSGTSPLHPSASHPKFKLNKYNTGSPRLCAPSDLSVSAQSTSTLQLYWKDNSENEQGFGIERQPEGLAFSYLNSSPANSTQYSDGTASEGTYYCYRVTAYTSSLTSPYSNTSCDLTFPAQPTGLQVDTVSASSLTLTWFDNSSKETNYLLERCQGVGCSSFSEIAQMPSNTTSYQDTGLSEAQTYCYRVRAKRTYATLTKYSDYSASQCKTTKPLPPTSLSANAVAYNRIDLSWTDNSSGETGFYIERTTYTTSCEVSSWTQIASVGTNTVSYSDTTVQKKTTYCYRVRAYKTVGSETVYSDYSNTATATTPDVPIPNAPSSLQIVYQGATTLAMSWQDNSDNEDGFGIERCQGAGCTNFAFRATVGANTTTYQDSGLIEGTTYCYRVTAYNTYGSSSPSNTACGTTQLLAPTGLTTGFTGSAINLYWVDNSSAEENYLVERNVNNGGWTQIASLPPNSTTYSDTNYFDGVSNCYRVRAKKGSVYSDYSNTSCTTPPLNPPTSLNILSEQSTPVSSAVTLNWVDNSSSEDGFYVLRSLDGSSYSRVATLPANTTQATVWELQEGVVYWFKVSAYKGSSESSFSNTVSSEAVPYAPSQITYSSLQYPRKVLIMWQDNSQIETSYEVLWRPSSSSSYTTETTSSSAETFSKEFSDEITYCVKVRAKKVKSSSPSDEICFVALSSPSPVRAEETSSNSIKIVWQDSSTRETGFRIEYNSGSGWTYLATASPNSITYVHTGISGRYCYRVRTETGYAFSDWSNISCASAGVPTCTTLWQTSLGSSITQAVASDGENIFVAVSTGYIFSLSILNGSISWSQPLGASPSSNISIAKTGGGIKVFIGTSNGYAHSIAKDGTKISKNLGAVLVGSAAYGGYIFATTSTGIVKLNSSLQVLKSVSLAGTISTAPVVDKISGKVYVAREDGSLHAFDTDLNSLWSLSVGSIIKSSPSLGEKGDIFFGAENGIYKVSVASSPSTAWTYSTPSPSRSTPSLYLYGSYLTAFVTAGQYLYAITDNKTSASLMFSYNLGSGVDVSPAVADDRVFVAFGGGIKAISFSGSEICSTNLPSSPSSHIIMVGSVVLVPAGDTLYAIQSSSPKAKYPFPDFNAGGQRALEIHPTRAFGVERYPFSICPISAFLYIPKTYDFDGDEYSEIVAAYADSSGTTFLLSHQGNILWSATTGGAVWDVPAIGDIDGNGNQEIVFGNDAGSIYAFSPGGQVKTGFPISPTSTGGCKIRSTTLANLDADSALEIIATDVDTTSSCGKIRVYDYNGSATSLKWEYRIGSLASFAVVEGSGSSAQIFVGDRNGNLWRFYADGTTSVFSVSPGYQLSSPTIGDVDGDGAKDVVFGSGNGYIYVYGTDGVLKASYNTGESGKCFRPPVLADIDGDGKKEILINSAPCTASGSSTLYVLKYSAGLTLLWSKYFENAAFSAPVVADIDIDGEIEIINLTQESKLHIMRKDGAPHFGSSYFLGPIQYGSRGSPSVGDIDKNGMMDIIFGDMSGCIRKFEFGEGTAVGQILSSSYRKNPQNNANYF